MTDELLQDVRAAVASLGADADRARSELGDATEAVTAAASEARRLGALGDDAGAAGARKDTDDLRVARREVGARIAEIDSGVVEQLRRLVEAEVDPCYAEADVPLLLLPVRIETRYTGDRGALRVRIYPDDVHVDRLDRGLSDSEQDAGTTYWTDLWSGAKTETEAWNVLLQAVHPNRAAWVAYALTPMNLGARPDPPAAAPAPSFPTVTHRSRPAPVARALPDRFVVMAEQGGVTSTAVGKPVPPRVVVGLGGEDDPSALVADTGVTLGPGMAWMVDFAEAESVGLAVTLPLSTAGAPVDRLLVFGVRSSLDPAAALDEVGQLLLSHLYGDGFAFLPQGTPTNNTETDRAAWTARPGPVQPATRADATSVAAESNAAVLAHALGLDPALFAAADGAPLAEQELAAAASTALWSATWGTFFDRLIADIPGHGPSDDQLEAARDQFQDHVRGRGPLPAIRIGNQPYGVLPVSSVQEHWVPDGGDPIGGKLLDVLRRIRDIWHASLPNVPSLPSVGSLDETLLEILGSAPQMLGLRVRSVASETVCEIAPPLLGVTGLDTELQQALDLMVWGTLGLPADVAGFTGTLGKTTRPLGLPLVHDSDPAFIAALLVDGPRTVASVLQALLELAYDREHRAVEAACPPERAEQLVELGAQAAGDLDDAVRRVASETVAGKANPREQAEAAAALTEKFGWAGPVTLTLADPVAGVRGSLASIALQSNVAAATAPKFALQTLGAWFRANARLAQVRDALEVLAAATTDERQLAVAEALDCASHRLDAWTTSLVSKRMLRLREATPQGVMVGAYGFVERIAPGASSARDGGYVLAPSLQHAATAGVLRSAYLTHNADASGNGAFAVDLSSARIRSALNLVEGIRNGQPLAALLGYRFERLLHESALGLDRFVLSLRALAPLVAGKLTDRAEAPPQHAREAVSATNVVDGVKLLALRSSGTNICAALSSRPANNPYLDPSRPWTGPDTNQCAAINAALDDIAAAYDAAADLLLAESVHQLVQGNATRATAALDALGGDALPSDPEIARIPPRGVSITHRLLHLSRDAATGAGGWSTTTPRAQAEPRLARWAEEMLGPADAIVVQIAPNGARTTLDAARLAAIDIVYDAAVRPVLARRVRRAIPNLRRGRLVQRRDPTWPDGLRAFGEVAVYAARAPAHPGEGAAGTPAHVCAPRRAGGATNPRRGRRRPRDARHRGQHRAGRRRRGARGRACRDSGAAEVRRCGGCETRRIRHRDPTLARGRQGRRGRSARGGETAPGRGRRHARDGAVHRGRRHPGGKGRLRRRVLGASCRLARRGRPIRGTARPPPAGPVEDPPLPSRRRECAGRARAVRSGVAVRRRARRLAQIAHRAARPVGHARDEALARASLRPDRALARRPRGERDRRRPLRPLPRRSRRGAARGRMGRGRAAASRAVRRQRRHGERARRHCRCCGEHRDAGCAGAASTPARGLSRRSELDLRCGCRRPS